MDVMLQAAAWIKEPSPDVGVVIVISASLPKYIIDQVHIALDDWDQVAYLAVHRPAELMRDWLQSGAKPTQSGTPSHGQARQLLSPVCPNCFLLDVEVEAIPSLAWLGSVCGHKLRVLELSLDGLSNVEMDQQVERILSAARTLARCLLQERCAL
ncbi:transketolase [Pseudomonas sp. NFACC37-1]|uniref:transketolase n=1 Tax=Pseudomonas sp. NFACC37-1 TaxID=1566196 RepID=UPI000883D3E9|nr:transketolase [Pseudomonas sp. NFACC37-1]SCX85677.1 hypothetical protein SAMN03159391_00439 [Pseudomonas sp. NFACC37-1]